MEPLVTSVQVERVGGHDHVRVFLRGQCVGTLLASPGDGALLRAVLSAERIFGIGRTGSGPIRTEERLAWQLFACRWVSGEPIGTDPATAGRLLLRLLERIDELEDRVDELEAQAHERPTLDPAATADGPSWLVKDFHVLYRAALAAVRATEDGPPPGPEHVALQLHLDRLAPAVAQCEAVRASLAARPAVARLDGRGP